jgi:hypothetical protein
MSFSAIPKAGNIAQHTVHNVLTAVPKYLVDKLLANSPDSEEIILGSKVRVITGTKYRKFCRAKYGPNLLDLFADKYLSNPTTEGHLAFITGPTAVRVYRGLLGYLLSILDFVVFSYI